MEKRRKEAEERELVRKQREEKEREYRAKEAEKARIADEQATQNLIEELKEMGRVIDLESSASNPFFDKIEVCNSLIKQFTKDVEPEESKKSDTVQKTQTSSLESAVKSGKVLAAPSKHEKDQ